jgi:gamma-glutamyltranspeptidase
MSKTIRIMLGVLALAVILPLEALGQAKPPAQATAFAVDPAVEARWNNLFQAAAVLAHEGMEVHRISAAEKKQIDDFIAQTKAFITKAKDGGISEAEEDGVDNGIAQLFAMIAKNMSDEQRKAAAAPPYAVDAAVEARWNNLFQAAAVLAHEGVEVHRITPAEKKQIDDFIAQTKGFILKAKDGGISEAEEDGIDNGIAQLFAMIAKNISDVQRKAAPPPAKK